MNINAQDYTEQLKSQIAAGTITVASWNEKYIIRDLSPKDWCHCIVDGDNCGEGCMNGTD